MAITRYQYQMRLAQQWQTVELLWITLLHYQVYFLPLGTCHGTAELFSANEIFSNVCRILTVKHYQFSLMQWQYLINISF